MQQQEIRQIPWGNLKSWKWFLRGLVSLVLILILFLIVNFLIPTILPTKEVSNVHIRGFIVQNQKWNGKIIIDGDLVTALGTKITITPGTVILIAIKDDKSNFDLLPWHKKGGVNTGEEYFGVKNGEPFWDEREKIQVHLSNLEALGTKDLPITITSDSSSGSPYDINVIKVNKGILSNVRMASYRRFEIGSDVVIRESNFDNVGECAICITSGRPTLVNNVFGGSLREHIWVSKASPRITDNIFAASKGAGVRIDPGRIGIPIISYNNFEMPESVAIEVLSGDELQGGVISFNMFSGGSIIKLTCDSRIKIAQNNILARISFGGSGCADSYTFGPNYWGTLDIKTILNERIINRSPGFEVLIPTALTSPPEQAGKR